MKIVLFLVSLSYILETTKAIRCLTCLNAKSNRECLKIGKVVECKENEDACQNEVRRDGRSLLITKRCKQSLACTNNFVQNNRAAWSPVQCNMEQQHTVCRCCCYDNSCNVDPYLCPNDCSPLDVPTDGGKQCQYVDRPTELGSECIFTCDEGYTLVGSPSSTCVTENYRSIFTHPTPECVPDSGEKKCNNQGPLVNGGYGCSDESMLDSTCEFTCDEGYFLHPNTTSNTCEQTSSGTDWNRPMPCCSPGSPLPGTCPPYAVMDIVFSLDNPASVGQRAWLSQDRFRKTLQNQFVTSPILAKFWNVLFDTDVTMGNIDDPDYIIDPDIIDKPYYHIGIALSHILTDTFKVGEGERPDAPNVAIFVTDGNVPDELEVDWIRKNAQALRDSGVTIYAIGVGDKEPLEQTLNDLTVQANIYRVNTYTDLVDNVDVIAQMLCPNLCPANTLA